MVGGSGPVGSKRGWIECVIDELPSYLFDQIGVEEKESVAGSETGQLSPGIRPGVEVGFPFGNHSLLRQELGEFPQGLRCMRIIATLKNLALRRGKPGEATFLPCRIECKGAKHG